MDDLGVPPISGNLQITEFHLFWGIPCREKIAKVGGLKYVQIRSMIIPIE